VCLKISQKGRKKIFAEISSSSPQEKRKKKSSIMADPSRPHFTVMRESTFMIHNALRRSAKHIIKVHPFFPY